MELLDEEEFNKLIKLAMSIKMEMKSKKKNKSDKIYYDPNLLLYPILNYDNENQCFNNKNWCFQDIIRIQSINVSEDPYSNVVRDEMKLQG